jgi:hypothetical protein
MEDRQCPLLATVLVSFDRRRAIIANEMKILRELKDRIF